MYLAMNENKIDYATLKKEIIEKEGMVLHCYDDPLGKKTIGVGRLITEDGGITEEEALYLLDNDIKKIEQFLDERWAIWRDLPLDAQYVTFDLCFNVGLNGFMAFRKTRAYMELGEWDKAAEELLNSKYHEQLPRRSMINSERLRKCADSS